ncbi:GIY-YIG nuclease family protein [Streptomyces sp. NPDC088252]|uniref:GIY-YIG nuclease family protein n=1 Tax=unclassified Streptomyces TaxID=2593676 RepID=UPI00380701C1
MSVPNTPDSRRAAVYRLYDEDGELLYIGSSYDPARRCKDHHEKPWWPQVAQRTVVWHKTRAAAYKKEAKAIKAERPRHNQVSTPEYADRRSRETRARGTSIFVIAATATILKDRVGRKAMEAGFDSKYAGAVAILAERAYKLASGKYPNGVNHPPLEWVDSMYSRFPSQAQRADRNPAA